MKICMPNRFENAMYQFYIGGTMNFIWTRDLNQKLSQNFYETEYDANHHNIVYFSERQLLNNSAVFQY